MTDAKTTGDFSDREWSDEPQAIFGSDPMLVQEIYELEKNVEAMFNKEFLTNPGEIVHRHYSKNDDVSFIDILSPGQYFGKDVLNWWEWIGSQFVGDLWLRNMRIYARENTGFVYMNQVYQGDHGGEKFLWVMRQTDVVEKQDGEWRIMHTHLSFAGDPVELDPASWKLDFEYKPRLMPWDAVEKGEGYGETPEEFEKHDS
jgi:ketosteroid isomerase-like protein